MEENQSLRRKLWRFGEGPLFWGGVALILGAMAASVSFAIILIIGAIPLWVGILRSNFFAGKARRDRIIGNISVCLATSLVLFVVWKIVPRPKEAPTAEVIAQEVVRLFNETSPVDRTTPSQPIPQNPHLAALVVSQSDKASTRADAKYQIQAVVQTTNEFPTLNMTLQCDKSVVDFGPYLLSGGRQMMVRMGIVKEHPNVLLYSYESSTPAFGPANPLIFEIWSNEPITCKHAAAF